METNITRSGTFYVQTTQDIFLIYSKALTQATLCYNWVTILPAATEIWPKNVILHYCDLERSRSSVKIKICLSALHHLPIGTHVKFHRNLVASFSITVEQLLTKMWPGERRKKKRKNKEQTRKLHLHANVTKKSHHPAQSIL